MEKKMENQMDNQMETLGSFKGYIGILPLIIGESNGQEMENDMKTGLYRRLCLSLGLCVEGLQKNSIGLKVQGTVSFRD